MNTYQISDRHELLRKVQALVELGLEFELNATIHKVLGVPGWEFTISAAEQTS